MRNGRRSRDKKAQDFEGKISNSQSHEWLLVLRISPLFERRALLLVSTPLIAFEMSIGVPIKLLHEAQGHIITLELKTGQVYRGKLFEGALSFLQARSFRIVLLLLADYSFLSLDLCRVAEDNMNVQLKDITVTARDGRVSQLDQVYIRGSHVRFFIVPDMLKNAPMFKKIGPGAMKA